MSNEKDSQHTIDLLSEDEVSERMTSFKEALARMNADPREAARIEALAGKIDQEIPEILAAESPHEYDPEARLRAHIMAVPPTENQTLAGLERLREAEFRAQQRLLEAERTAYRAEAELAMADQRATLIVRDAERHADILQQEAVLGARQIELDALREKLAADQLKLDTAFRRASGREKKENKKARGASLRNWHSWIGLNPAFTIAMTAVIGAFIAMQYHVFLVASIFAIAAAFNVISYAFAILISAVQMNRSGPPGPESALRLLLGPRGGEAGTKDDGRRGSLRSRRSPHKSGSLMLGP